MSEADATRTLLDGWLAPLGASAFFSQYWCRQHAVLTPATRPTFDLADFEAILNDPRAAHPRVRCLDRGGAVDPLRYTRSGADGLDPAIDRRKLQQALDGGATVRVQAVPEVNPALRAFAAQLADVFGCRVDANAYFSRGPTHGVRAHYDCHHVFALQVAGCKRWRLGPVVVDAPHPEVRPQPLDAPPTRATVVVHPGDVLYLPPGLWHSTETDDVSLHVTVGVHPPDWSAVLREMVAAAMRRHPLLRAHLPFKVRDGRCVYGALDPREVAAVLGLVGREAAATLTTAADARHAESLVRLPAHGRGPDADR